MNDPHSPEAGVRDLSAALIAAYKATLYEVQSPNGLITLKVGMRLDDSQALLGTSAERVSVVTAFNPFSRCLTSEDNLIRHRLLIEAVKEANRKYLPAQGRDPTSEWASESSLAILDPTDTELDDWMRTFEQNAVLIAENGSTAKLRLHPNLSATSQK